MSIGKGTSAGNMLKALVERIERLDEEIRSLNDDKRDIYREAKSNGFDVPAIKRVVAYRRKDSDEAAEADAIFETYLHAVQGAGTDDATRVQARERRTKIPAGDGDHHQEDSHAADVAATSQASAGDGAGATLSASAAGYADFPDPPAFLDRRALRC